MNKRQSIATVNKRVSLAEKSVAGVNRRVSLGGEKTSGIVNRRVSLGEKTEAAASKLLVKTKTVAAMKPVNNKQYNVRKIQRPSKLKAPCKINNKNLELFSYGESISNLCAVQSPKLKSSETNSTFTMNNSYLDVKPINSNTTFNANRSITKPSDSKKVISKPVIKKPLNTNMNATEISRKSVLRAPTTKVPAKSIPMLCKPGIKTTGVAGKKEKIEKKTAAPMKATIPMGNTTGILNITYRIWSMKPMFALFQTNLIQLCQKAYSCHFRLCICTILYR